METLQVLYNNLFQSILMFYQRIPSYFMSVMAWEGVGYSQNYSVLYGYSILPSYPGKHFTCTIHVTATNPSVIPPHSLPKHTNTSVVHRCIYKNNTWTIIILLWLQYYFINNIWKKQTYNHEWKSRLTQLALLQHW